MEPLQGKRAWGYIACPIATAKIDDSEPCAHLNSTLAIIAAGHTKNRIDELLPWNFKPAS